MDEMIIVIKAKSAQLSDCNSEDLCRVIYDMVCEVVPFTEGNDGDADLELTIDIHKGETQCDMHHS